MRLRRGLRQKTVSKISVFPTNQVVSSIEQMVSFVDRREFLMLFQLQNVTKTYGPVTALRQLSVDVPVGAVGLLGPNGAGKTTLVRALLGLISIDSGGGQVLGMDIDSRRLDIRQAVGFVPEDECLFPGAPGVEFVSYAGE